MDTNWGQANRFWQAVVKNRRHIRDCELSAGICVGALPLNAHCLFNGLISARRAACPQKFPGTEAVLSSSQPDPGEDLNQSIKLMGTEQLIDIQGIQFQFILLVSCGRGCFEIALNPS